MPATAKPVFLAPFVEALVHHLRDAQAAGKLDDDQLERALSPAARAWVEGVCPAPPAVGLEDVESLAGLVVDPLADAAGLARPAGELAGWVVAEPRFEALVDAARGQIDGAGLVASQVTEWVLAEPDWSYAGGGEGFEVRIAGLAAARPALKRLLGALIARIVAIALPERVEMRFDAADGCALVLRGRLVPRPRPMPGDPREVSESVREARLHRVALVA